MDWEKARRILILSKGFWNILFNERLRRRVSERNEESGTIRMRVVREREYDCGTRTRESKTERA